MEKAIGVLDSGLGGLSVWRAIRQLLPTESMVYYADQAHCPYGNLATDQVCAYTEACVQFLLKKECKLIVLACNTATAAVINELRHTYPVPFVGMEPAIKPAAQATKSKKVGVLATAGTLGGQLYLETSRKYASEVEVFVQSGEGLVELVEMGKLDGPEVEQLLRQYLTPMLEKGIDQLVLGCTHYPFLLESIQEICGPSVSIINPAPAVARRVKQIILAQNLASGSKQASYSFHSSLQSTDTLMGFVDQIKSTS